MSETFGIGFDLQKIEIYNFMNYKSPVIFDFQFPYLVIAGPTGSGKTTILDALTFALFGRSSRTELPTVKIEDICGKNGKVICHFKTKLASIHVKRGRNKQGRSYLEISVDGRSVPGTIPDLNKLIRSDLLGMNYQAFKHATIIRQDEMKSLGSKSSTERLKTLQNLFRLDIFEKASRHTTLRLQDIINEKNRLSFILEAKQEKIEKIPNIQEDIQNLKTKFTQKDKHHKSITKNLTDFKAQEQEKRKTVDRIQQIQTKHKTAQTQLKTLSDELQKKQQQLGEFISLKDKRNDLKSQVDAIRESETLLTNLQKLQQEDTFVRKQIETINQRINRRKATGEVELARLKKRIIGEETRSKNLSTDIDHKTAFKALKQEGRLVERVQRISIEKTWNLADPLLNEIDQEQKRSKTELKDLQKTTEKINVDSFALSEIQNQITDLQQNEKLYSKQLEEDLSLEDAELKKAKFSLDEIGFSSEKQILLTELLAKDKENKKTRLEYEKYQQEIAKLQDPSSAIASLQEQITSLKQSITEFTEKLSGSAGIIDEFNQIIKEIETLQQQSETVRVKVVRLDEQIKSLERTLDELIQLRPEVKQLIDKHTTLTKEETILDRLKTDVFHTRGAPFYAIQKMLPWIGRRASYILGELTNQRLTSVQLEQVASGKKTTGFNIFISTPTGVRDVATFSGGERTQINAALRLAISEELSELGQKTTSSSATKKTLFIDEGDLGSLDSLEAQQAFVNKLFKLTNKFKIILITHLTEIADQFPHSINIGRDRYGRSIKGDLS